MEKSESQQRPSHQSKVEEPSDEQLLPAVAKEATWMGGLYYEHNGFWCPAPYFPNVIRFQRHFQAKDTDIILATMPKSGTTWLKALTFSIVNRNRYPFAQSPVLTTNPHALIPFFELDTYIDAKIPNLEDIPCPRIFSTHLPCNGLTTSILDSKCRVIYICRNPLDQFVSYWHFAVKKLNELTILQPPPIDEALESFCQGLHGFGPFWEHMLSYWNASLKHPQKVLFLKYEDLKENTIFKVKKIAEFLGLPFSEEEERNGLVEDIVNLCSFENLKNLEANKKGQTYAIKHSVFFRKGEVGDWINYVTPSMAERVQKVMQEKLGGSGLAFDPIAIQTTSKV